MVQSDPMQCLGHTSTKILLIDKELGSVVLQVQECAVVRNETAKANGSERHAVVSGLDPGCHQEKWKVSGQRRP